MICPKCQNVMKTVDKNGVHIDQCESCKGIFLDKGELEQISAAESAYYEPAAPPPYVPEGGAAMPPPMQQMPPRRPQQRYPDSPRGYQGGGRGYYPDSPRPYGGGGHRGGHGHGGHRKRSFLENLFD